MTEHSGNKVKEHEWRAEASCLRSAVRRYLWDCASSKSNLEYLLVPFEIEFHSLSHCFRSLSAAART